MFRRERFFLVCGFALLMPAGVWGQTQIVASRTDGITVYYHETLHQAFESAAADTKAAGGRPASPENPVEIILLADIVLDEPLIVEDGVHIRLVAGGSDRTIQRGSGNIEYPVVWITGEAASLTLGKPSMEYELFIDGGCLNNPPIHAHAALVALNGPDAKLIMYDKVTLQNNYNNGTGLGYQLGAGLFVRTSGDNLNRQVEFIMKGGVIRGNKNYSQSSEVNGGGVYVAGSGRFTMEGGVIMDNTTQTTGGGVHITRASFKKTGGIIYGANAPPGFRNNAAEGLGSPRIYGHAISVNMRPVHYFRDDTVKENENLSFSGTPEGGGIFGEGEKWDTQEAVLRRNVLSAILAILIIVIPASLILRKRVLKNQVQTAVNMAHNTPNNVPEINLDNTNLSVREREICELLLSELSMKQIAYTLKLSYSGATFHSQNLYRKLGIQSRTELFTRFGKK